MPADITTTKPDTAIAPPPDPIARVPVSLGIAPSSLEEGWRLAQMMAKSGLVPKNFQNHPEDILVAIQLGVEVGFAPMQALQSIAVINGRPSIWGDGFLGLIMTSPLYADHQEYYEVQGHACDAVTADDLKKDTTAAVCVFQRRGKATPTLQRFSVAQAKAAKLWGKAGPWQEYPDRMLKMRARSWAGRDAFPDLLRGLRTAEEAHDEPAPAPVMMAPRRMSDTAPATARPLDPDKVEVKPTPTAEGTREPGSDDGE